MEKQVIELRGHHLPHLREYFYNRIYGFSDVFLGDVFDKYGKDFFINKGEVFRGIFEGNSSIKIIAGQDSLCNKCKFKIMEGCSIEGEFISEGKNAKIDKKDIDNYGLKLGKEYSGKELASILMNLPPFQ